MRPNPRHPSTLPPVPYLRYGGFGRYLYNQRAAYLRVVYRNTQKPPIERFLFRFFYAATHA
jgi:hypothetical protein